MKWLVGLDLRPSSQGAIRFGSWLARHSRPELRQELVGIHVLEEDHLQVVLRYHHLDDVVEQAMTTAVQVVDEAGAAEELRDVRVISGLRADRTLADARAELGADGLLIGRQAKREGHEFVRLGKVARRMLRSLQAPVFVVPPDLAFSDIGEGPVVALTKLSADSVGACQMARGLAHALGRELHVAHVVPTPEDFGAHYLPHASIQRIRFDHHATGERELAGWVTTQSLGACTPEVLQGPVVDEVVAYARRTDACLVVCGSRGLGTLERFMQPSVGSSVAAIASCAVAVVPGRPAEK